MANASGLTSTRRSPACLRDQWSLPSHGVTIQYLHARLFMNHRFYGPSRGLPPESFDFKHLTQHDHSPGRQWKLEMMAAVKGRELILFGRHILVFGGSARQLRAALDDGDGYQICNHVGTKSSPLLSQLASWKTISALRRGPRRDGIIRECTDATGNCLECDTEYRTTIRRRTTRPHTWDVVIDVGHGLGKFRSPADANWTDFRRGDVGK